MTAVTAKIRILKDHEASPDGIRIASYKKDEILELGTARLTPHLYEWHVRNKGFSEVVTDEKTVIEPQIEQKAITPVIENKAIQDFVIENKAISNSEENKQESQPEIILEEVKEGKFTNPFKRKK